MMSLFRGQSSLRIWYHNIDLTDKTLQDCQTMRGGTWKMDNCKIAADLMNTVEANFNQARSAILDAATETMLAEKKRFEAGYDAFFLKNDKKIVFDFPGTYHLKSALAQNAADQVGPVLISYLKEYEDRIGKSLQNCISSGNRYLNQADDALIAFEKEYGIHFRARDMDTTIYIMANPYHYSPNLRDVTASLSFILMRKPLHQWAIPYASVYRVAMASKHDVLALFDIEMQYQFVKQRVDNRFQVTIQKIKMDLPMEQ